MNEHVLLDYFEKKVKVEDLAEDLKNSQEKTGHDTTTVYVNRIEDAGSFTVTKSHLLRLCDDVEAGNLSFQDLNTIAFAMITSEFFLPDKSDEIVDRVIFEWDNPEIGFPLNPVNMNKWRHLLESGMDYFDPNELRQTKNK